MAKHLTSKQQEVEHQHIDPDLNAVDQEIARRFMAELFPQASVVNVATLRYNCHGFALAPEHLGWYSFPDLFLSDNYTGTPKESPQLGDVVIYSKNALITHSAVVVEVNGSEIKMLQSKWGGVAEVKHPPDHVPSVYGKPVVLLRPLSGVSKHPAALDAESSAAAATGGAADTTGGAADTTGGAAETATLNATAEAAWDSTEAPERFMLMLASTPEVRRRILESRKSAQASTDASLAGLSSEEVPDEESTDTSQDAIEEALKQLAGPEVQFGLMLASSPDVLRLAAAEQAPVSALVKIGQTNQEAGRAVLELFKKEETQADEQITGITLYLLAQLPLKEAVEPIARYLAAGKFSSPNGGLAVDALGAAIAKLGN